MPNDAKGIFHFYAKQGMTDREAMFKMIDHCNDLHWKNDALLRAENEALKKRVVTLEADARKPTS